MIGGDYFGAEYRIGELASLANVSKRTVDYYTTLGMLHPKRSPSNYRFYEEDALLTLKLIEQCKKNQMSLTEIKGLLNNRVALEHKEDVISLMTKVHSQMKEMEKEIIQLKLKLENTSEEEKEILRKQLSAEGSLLIQTLLLLLTV